MDEVKPLTATPSLSAGPSLPCDLSWLLSVAARPSWRSKYPLLTEMFNGREELAERVKDFWADHRAETCFAEMQVLAQHAGAIATTEPEFLWRALAEAVTSVPLDQALESETFEDRAVIISRLRQLKESPALVRDYIDLLREVWEPIDALWQAALPQLQEAAEQLLVQLERGRELGDLIPQECEAFRARLPVITAGINVGRPLFVVPCFFFGKSLYLEFPGLTLIGTGVAGNDLGARARTELVARRLKTMADPTRLALLHYLSTVPSTVGELASSFQLAQPTVSMHMKLLRQTGLVVAERRDGRLHLSTDPQAVESLLDDLRRVVVQGARTTGSDRMPATVVDATRSA
jgi:DNA-binding transcriptional ArsR family regulator